MIRIRSIFKAIAVVLTTTAAMLMTACVVLPPVFFNVEVESLKDEATQRFPIESKASAFEAWFYEKMKGSGYGPILGGSIAGAGACEARTMVIERAEGCINQLVSKYCVSRDDGLARLDFRKAGYC